MSRSFFVSTIAATLAIVLAVFFIGVDRTPIRQEHESTAIHKVDSRESQGILSKSSQFPIIHNLPSSLKGTSHGVTLVSHLGELLITASLKDLFDYYLSASGEESTEEINDRVEKDLSSQLTDLALEQALNIWRHYILYKSSLVEFDQQYQIDIASLSQVEHLAFLQQRQQSLIALQDQIFSASTAEILFKFDRQLDNHTLEKAKILASDLTEEQKRQWLINLDAQLPIETVLSNERIEKQKHLLAISQEHNLTDEQRYRLRAEQVGEAAASRLQLLDIERSEWKQRISVFIEKKQVLLESGLAPKDYKASLEKLYQKNFSPEEQLRAKALTQ